MVDGDCSVPPPLPKRRLILLSSNRRVEPSPGGGGGTTLSADPASGVDASAVSEARWAGPFQTSDSHVSGAEGAPLAKTSQRSYVVNQSLSGADLQDKQVLSQAVRQQCYEPDGPIAELRSQLAFCGRQEPVLPSRAPRRLLLVSASSCIEKSRVECTSSLLPEPWRGIKRVHVSKKGNPNGRLGQSGRGRGCRHMSGSTRPPAVRSCAADIKRIRRADRGAAALWLLPSTMSNYVTISCVKSATKRNEVKRLDALASMTQHRHRPFSEQSEQTAINEVGSKLFPRERQPRGHACGRGNRLREVAAHKFAEVAHTVCFAGHTARGTAFWLTPSTISNYVFLCAASGVTEFSATAPGVNRRDALVSKASKRSRRVSKQNNQHACIGGAVSVGANRSRGRGRGRGIPLAKVDTHNFEAEAVQVHVTADLLRDSFWCMPSAISNYVSLSATEEAIELAETISDVNRRLALASETSKRPRRMSKQKQNACIGGAASITAGKSRGSRCGQGAPLAKVYTGNHHPEAGLAHATSDLIHDTFWLMPSGRSNYVSLRTTTRVRDSVATTPWTTKGNGLLVRTAKRSRQRDKHKSQARVGEALGARTDRLQHLWGCCHDNGAGLFWLLPSSLSNCVSLCAIDVPAGSGDVADSMVSSQHILRPECAATRGSHRSKRTARDVARACGAKRLRRRSGDKGCDDIFWLRPSTCSNYVTLSFEAVRASTAILGNSGEGLSDCRLDAVTLAALPLDAPVGHEAFRKCRRSVDSSGNNLIHFHYTNGGVKARYQVTELAAGSLYAAARIARACYCKCEEGHSKEGVLEFRKECYIKLKMSSPFGSAARRVRSKRTVMQKHKLGRSLVHGAACGVDTGWLPETRVRLLTKTHRPCCA